MIKHVSTFLLAAIILLSCEEPSTSSQVSDDFDRTKMMENWVDDFIVPGYDSYVIKLQNLQLAYAEFENEPSRERLSLLSTAYLEAYTNWQRVSMFEIGKAEQLGLRNSSNIFPTNTALIDAYIEGGSYNLALPSSRPAQGFPALDYLLFKSGEEDILGLLSQEAHRNYMGALIDRLIAISVDVKNSWTADRRLEFTTNKASTDRLINDYLYYYEKYLRAGKVGIPAGVFSGDALPENVEAPHSEIYSRDLLLESLDAVQDFFNSENGISDYLVFLGKGELVEEINRQWEEARSKILNLDSSLKEQVIKDKVEMLAVYDALQKVVVLLKVDVFQALSIQVDYVDADGD